MDIFETLKSTLNEWGVETDGITYRDAIIAYRDYLGQKLDSKAFKCMFGDFGICAVDYDILLDTDLENARKQLAKCKKQYKGLKINIRVMAVLGFSGKTYAAVAEPKRVLWELSGVDADAAAEIATTLSDLLGIALDVVPA